MRVLPDQFIEQSISKHLMHRKFRVIGKINGSEKRAVVIIQVYALFKKVEINLETGEVKEYASLSK